MIQPDLRCLGHHVAKAAKRGLALRRQQRGPEIAGKHHRSHDSFGEAMLNHVALYVDCRIGRVGDVTVKLPLEFVRAVRKRRCMAAVAAQ